MKCAWASNFLCMEQALLCGTIILLSWFKASDAFKTSEVITNQSKQDQITAIQFFSREGSKPVEIHRRTFAMYYYYYFVLWKTTATDWLAMLSDGREKTTDLSRASQVHTVFTEALTAILTLRSRWTVD